jgi:trehalose 6-phosphate synthase
MRGSVSNTQNGETAANGKNPLTNRRLVVVSNRGPFKFSENKWVKTVGGMAAVIEPILQTCGGTWWVQGDVSLEGPQAENYKIGHVGLTAAEAEGYYDGFANQALWPLLHSVGVRPRFDASHWEAYRAANLRFAQAVSAQVASEPSVVFIQDFHLCLVASFVRELQPRVPVAQFFHIPWCRPEDFAACPWGSDLLTALTHNQLIGFNCQTWVNNFLDCARLLPGADVDDEKGTIKIAGRVVQVRTFPAGIDALRFQKQSQSAGVSSATERFKAAYYLDGRSLAVSVDRCDYTKGIPQRLLAIERLMERDASWATKWSFVQVVSPSREAVAEYRRVGEEAEALTARINRRFSVGGIPPVHLVRTIVPDEDVIALFRLARMGLVTPLRDGMNLVAKEFIACRQEADGVLVLSRFAGAAAELSAAVLTDPNDPETLANSIEQAARMPKAEETARMAALRKQVFDCDVYFWAQRLVHAIGDVARPF